MKFGNAAWGFRETPLKEQLKITHDMGLEYLELGIANAPGDIPLSASVYELEAVKSLYQTYHVKLTYASTGNDFTNGDTRDVEKVKRVIEICQKLGVKYLRIFSGFAPVEDVAGGRWDNMIACLCQTARYAAEHDVCPVIETHGGVRAFQDGVEHFMSTSSCPEALYRMLEELPDTVKLNFDPANLWAVGMAHPEEVYAACKERIAMVHLKDFAKLPSGHIRPTACGEGGMDWDCLLKGMKDYKGAVLFEYENAEDVKEGTMRCYEYIRKKMADLERP